MVAVRSVASHEETLAEFSHALERSGVRAAVACLLRLTAYRHIGIFRIDGEQVRALVAVDREFPGATEVGAWPDAVARSCYLRDAEGRLAQAGAPAQRPEDGTHADCCAVPIMDPEGEVLGTLCLYDRLPVAAAPVDLELLLVAAAALAGHEALRGGQRPR